jgi:hypothetical protein
MLQLFIYFGLFMNYLFHEWKIIQSVVYFSLIFVSKDELFNSGIYMHIIFSLNRTKKLHKGSYVHPRNW